MVSIDVDYGQHGRFQLIRAALIASDHNYAYVVNLCVYELEVKSVHWPIFIFFYVEPFVGVRFKSIKDITLGKYLYLIPFFFVIFTTSSVYLTLIKIVKTILLEFIKISVISEPNCFYGISSISSINITLNETFNNFPLNQDNLLTISSTPLPNGSSVINEET